MTNRADSFKGIGALLCAAFLWLLLSAASPAWAAQTDGVHTVDIELACLTSLDERVVLGTEYDREFEVVSLEDDAYIRLTADLSVNERDANVTYVDPSSPEWIHAKDGWWYLKTPIGHGATALFDTNFILDSSGIHAALNDGKKVELVEVIRAEAIREDDVTPNWEADDPWEQKTTPDPVVDREQVDGSAVGALPQTGDAAPFGHLVVFAAVSGLVAVFVFERMRKRSHQ